MNRLLNLLIAEDNLDDVALLIESLEVAGFDCSAVRVDTEEDFRRELAKHPDAIISDYSMPGFTGTRALEILRESGLDIPFILVSGSLGEDLAVEAIRRGAADYLLKDRLIRIGSSMDRALREKELRAEQKRATERVAFMARLGLRLGAARQHAEAAKAVAEIAYDIFHWDACLLLLYNSETGSVTELFNADTIDGQRVREPRQVFLPEPSPLVRRILKRGGELILRTPAEQQAAPVEHRFGNVSRPSASLMFVPIRYENRNLGVLSVQSYRQNAFTAHDLETLQGLADHCAGALARLQAEEALRQAEELGRGVLNSMLAHIAVLDRGGKIVAVNDGWRKFGEEKGGLGRLAMARTDVGTNYLEVCRASDAPEAVKASEGLAAVLTGERPDFSIEYPSHGSEEERWFVMSATPLRSGGGGAVVAHLDITERKRTEQELSRTNRALRALTACNEAMARASSETDLLDRICRIVVEVGGYRMAWVGYARPNEEKSIEPVAQAGDDRGYLKALNLTWADTERGRGPAGIALRTGMPYLARDIRTNPDFSLWREEALKRGYASALMLPLISSGNRLGVLGIYSGLADSFDESESKLLTELAGDLSHRIAGLQARRAQIRAEAALRESEERFRSFIENATDLITVVQPDGLVEFQSPSVERVLGWSPDEIVSTSIYQIIEPTERIRLVTAVQKALLESELPVHVDARVRHRDGTFRSMRFVGKSMTTASGGRLIVFNARDLTDEKKLERQLHQAQKMEAFGQLSGGVAHDFNNLLTVITGHNQLLAMSLSPSDPNLESVNEIQKASERAASLTRQLLAFSRQQVLEMKVTNLNGIVTEVEKMLRRLIGEDVRLSTVLQPDVSLVRVDPGQIDQVIMNLAVNARDAMPRGGQLIIETHNAELDSAYAQKQPDVRPGKYVMLSVSDNGEGMPPEVLARIYEPFYTTKGVGKGTGLGLAVVHGIIKQSGGHISVYSEVGVGTTFKIYLPAVAGVAQPQRDENAAGSYRGSETVLVVEDEDAVRKLTVTSLERFGYKVLTAGNGSEALSLLEENDTTIDLLLTDVVMPEMGGRELAERLAVRHKKLKVVFLSGYTDDAIVRHGILEAGMPFLQKPFGPEALARKVREVLDKP